MIIRKSRTNYMPKQELQVTNKQNWKFFHWKVEKSCAAEINCSGVTETSNREIFI